MPKGNNRCIQIVGSCQPVGLGSKAPRRSFAASIFIRKVVWLGGGGFCLALYMPSPERESTNGQSRSFLSFKVSVRHYITEVFVEGCIGNASVALFLGQLGILEEDKGASSRAEDHVHGADTYIAPCLFRHSGRCTADPAKQLLSRSLGVP
jgi:hypothetical protein